MIIPNSDADLGSIRGFYGNYSVTVKYDGELKEENYFYMAKDRSNRLDIRVDNC